MKSIKKDIYDDVIESMGQSKMQEVCILIGNQKFSFAKCKKRIAEYKLLDLYEKYPVVQSLIRRTGISKNTIYRILKRYGKN